MPTQVHLTPTGHSPEHHGARLNFDRLLAIGATFAFWAVVLVGLKMLVV